MESRLRIAGNAVHPLLLMFPLGLFAMAIIFDVATMLGAPRIVGTLAFWNVVAGLVGGASAVSVAAIDMASAQHARVALIGAVGVLLDMGVLVAFAVVAMIRLRTADRVADSGLLALEIAVCTASGFSAWHGGRFGGSRVYARRGAAPPGAFLRWPPPRRRAPMASRDNR
jgi:uncharacterized membrane protein